MADKEVTEARRQARKKKHMLKRRGRLDFRTNMTCKRKYIIKLTSNYLFKYIIHTYAKRQYS